MRIEKRKPALAALLSLIAPGLGQLYNGQLMKGVILYFAAFLLQIVLLVTGLQYRFWGTFVLLFSGLISYLFIAGEAFLTAKKLRKISLRAFNKWYYYLFFVAIAIGTGTVASNQYDIKPYKNLSGAMIPTILINDHIFFDIRYYDEKRSKKGDVILFQNPKDQSQYFIKRIIATEDDILESRNKTIYVNGAIINEPYIQHVDNMIKPNDINQRDNFGPLTIPKGKVFVMGDNRDQSYDSRFYGPVDRKLIKGKALYIFWSKQRGRIGMEIK